MGSSGDAEVREGDGPDQKGHEDHRKDVGFHSDTSWKSQGSKGAKGAGFHFRRIALVALWSSTVLYFNYKIEFKL